MNPIFPPPQHIQMFETLYELPYQLVLAADTVSLPLAMWFAETLERRYDYKITIVDLQNTVTPQLTLIGAIPDSIDHARQPEGYILEINAVGVVIRGFDVAGVRYGLQSLLYMVEAAHQSGYTSATGIQLHSARIHDWPHKGVRGVHFYMPGRDEIPFFKRCLDWFAALKYNTLFIEVGAGMRYRSHPEINDAWEQFCREIHTWPGGQATMWRAGTPFEKNIPHLEVGHGACLEQHEVADLLSYARTLGFNVIPEVQSLSHAYYLCLAHPEIAEIAEDPYPDTFCPSNPRSYEIYFDVLDEVIKVFQPRMVHIGHDEVYVLAHCEQCQHHAPAELFAADVLKVHRFLKERGIRMCMWSDKLQPLDFTLDDGTEYHTNATERAWWRQPEAWQALDSIPRDVLLLEWLGNTDGSATRFFIANGFEVLAGNFGDVHGAMRYPQWSERSRDSKLVGAEVATWCVVSEFGLGYIGSVFNALMGSAMLWNGTHTDEQRSALVDEVVQRMPFARAILGGSARAPSQQADAHTTAVSLQPYHTGFHHLPFREPGRIGSIQLASAGVEGNTSVEVPLNCTAESLLITHGCETTHVRQPLWSFSNLFDFPKGDLIATYNVRFADGGEIDIPIYHGSHIANYDQIYGEHIDAIPYWADPIADGQGTLYQYEWINPFPSRQIQRIRFAHAQQAQGKVWVVALDTICIKGISTEQLI